MGLFEKIKSLLGMGTSGTKRDDSDVGVTVEREGSDRGSTATASENAVKGTDAGASTDDGSTAVEADEAETTDAGETAEDEAGGATDDVADEPEGSTDEAAAEPADSEADEATEPAESGPEETGDDEATVAPDEGEAAGTDDGDEDPVPSEAVDVIKGIGPTYAGRLADAGVETVADLAAADAAEVAERTDVPEGRLEDWIEKARARSR